MTLADRVAAQHIRSEKLQLAMQMSAKIKFQNKNLIQQKIKSVQDQIRKQAKS